MKIRYGIIAFYMVVINTQSLLNAQSDTHNHQQSQEHQQHDKHNKYKHDQGEWHEQGEEHTAHQIHSEFESHPGHQAHDDDGHSHDDEHADEQLIHLTFAQQEMAGITVTSVTAEKNISAEIYAPGEVVNNSYKTTIVTAQIDSKVLKRYIVLGQMVRGGDPLVKLFSQDMVAIQSQLKVAAKEWARVKSLGKKSVGSRRFVNAQVAFEKEKTNALALGMSDSAVTEFLQGKSPLALGQYILEAPYAGIIQSDNFQQGQLLLAGSPIATVVDESELWVEARLAPKLGQHFGAGSRATVVIRDRQFPAVVIQENHAIEEITRTRKVRLLIKNDDHLLHPGLFADVYLAVQGQQPGIVLPETALMRSSDGHWTVYIEQSPEEFSVQEVELINTIKDQFLVKGLYPGQRVVTQGAFFLASEQAKSGFDPHNH